MKVPPKRKGNIAAQALQSFCWRLNESPSEKEGKATPTTRTSFDVDRLNESPSEKEGKSG